MKNIRIHPLFFVLAIFLLIFGEGLILLSFLFAAIFHEYAHYIMAKKHGYALDKLYLMPYGACLKFQDNVFMPKDEVVIALTGPVSNLLLGLLIIAFWWIYPTLYSYTSYLVFANLVNGIFNLLPAYPLDGGRILRALLTYKFEQKKALKIITILNIIIGLSLLMVFCILSFFTIQYSIAIMSFFILLGVFDNRFSGKYSLYFLSVEKFNKIQRGIQVNSIAITSDASLYHIISKTKQDKFNLIYIIFKNGDVKVINENQLEKFITNYPLKLSLDDILISKNLNNKN